MGFFEEAPEVGFSNKLSLEFNAEMSAGFVGSESEVNAEFNAEIGADAAQ